MDISYYQKINNMHKTTTKKEVEIYNFKKSMLLDFEDNPLPFSVQIDGEDRKIFIASSSKEKMKKVLSKPDEVINMGSLIEWNNSNWLVVEKDPNEEIQSKCNMKQCESSVKWLNTEGEVKETPFTLNVKPTAAYGTEQDKLMILSRERRSILVQENQDTDKIYKGQRFLFDGRAWEVFGLNGLTEGLIEITVEEDQVNPSIDNLELRIADYYGKVANYSIEITNGQNNSLSLDDTLQLNVLVTNKGSQIFSPLLQFSSSDDTIAIVDASGLVTPQSQGEVNITVSYRGVNASITLLVTEKRVYNYTLDIVGSNEIKIGQKQKYQVIFYNNGSEISDNAIFTLISEDGLPTSLATLKVLDNNICEIEAGKVTGKVRLNVVNQNNLISGNKEIKIKSLL